MTTLAARADMKHGIAPSPLHAFVSTGAESAAGSSHLPNKISLARQIVHNLEHQHQWSDLHVHTHSPTTHDPLPRPLVSGLPPQRLYVHPDEQVQLLKKADRERKARAGGEAGGLEVRAEAEREWILPTRLDEKWTLRGLAQVFDAITTVPPAPDASTTAGGRPSNPWRTTKRVLLASVDTDSTVVYYIVHDGVVKPRQN
ncbi:hypothetical protein G6011_00651 [Alternaria panax]|uniref:tRNA-splicing endonuclease subunit Sen15 domain-containing protein n=1 Tax=Alternaria panax TaxID=48097 RepID=A0AAD4IJB5_9PLEO|nr:hypothetical protein G6011_00651 [Alternaria panax]